MTARPQPHRSKTVTSMCSGSMSHRNNRTQEKKKSQEEIPDDNVNLPQQTSPPKRIQLKSYTKNLSVKTERWRKKLATSLRSQTKDLRTWKAQERWKKELAIAIALKTRVLPFLASLSPPPHSSETGLRNRGPGWTWFEKSRARLGPGLRNRGPGWDRVWEIAGRVGPGLRNRGSGWDWGWEIAGRVGTRVEKSRAGLRLSEEGKEQRGPKSQ